MARAGRGTTTLHYLHNPSITENESIKNHSKHNRRKSTVAFGDEDKIKEEQMKLKINVLRNIITELEMAERIPEKLTNEVTAIDSKIK